MKTQLSGGSMTEKRKPVHIAKTTHRQLKEYVELNGLKIKNVADEAVLSFLAKKREAK